jgi:GTP-binding protein
VILREIDGHTCEPYETLVVEVPSEKLGPVMELVGQRRGDLVEMQQRGDFAHVTFLIPARGLIGLRTRMLTATAGEAIINHRFESYRPVVAEPPPRANGVLISNSTARAVGFALFGLQDRSELFVAPGDEVYEGMIVGENARGEDMTVNPSKEKKLTNVRAAGSDEKLIMTPPIRLTLEQALEFINDDELVEITPKFVRVRKKFLKEHERKKASRTD